MSTAVPSDPRAEVEGKEDRAALVRLDAAGESRLAGFAWAPEGAHDGLPLLVVIHGIARNAHGQARAFRPVAQARGWALVAPEFDERGHGDYQRLGRVGRGPRADHALEALVERAGERLSLRFGPRHLVGFSAGAQFAHRYLMAHPDRVDALVLGAPGWFTFPDPRRAYPYGLRVGRELPGVRLSPGDFLRRPVLLAVGSRDDARDPSLRQTRRVDRLQGHDRLERAIRWSEAMNHLARRRDIPEPVRLQVLKGAGHDFAECCAAGFVDVAAAFLDEVEASRARSATPEGAEHAIPETTPPKETR